MLAAGSVEAVLSIVSDSCCSKGIPSREAASTRWSLFQQFDDEFFKCNGIVCPIMVRRLVTTEENGKINTIFG